LYKRREVDQPAVSILFKL